LQALRRSAERPAPDRLFLATLRIRMPRNLWTGPFSSAHPELQIDVLNRVEVTYNVSVSDHWISGGPPGIWANEIAKYPDVVSVEPFAEVGEGSLYRIKYENPPIIDLYRRLGLPLRFPLRMQAGYLGWEIAARYSEFQAILKHARAADPEARIISIRRGPLRSHLPLLSEAQRQLLTDAMVAGYFAVPRGITLTALARKLNRSKSGISEAIALIEKKLLEAALRTPVGPV
jgi:HTH DNA binding domain